MTNIVFYSYCQTFVNVKDYTIFAEIKTNEMKEYEYTKQVATKKDFETVGTLLIHKDTFYQSAYNTYVVIEINSKSIGIDRVNGGSLAILQEFEESKAITYGSVFGENLRLSINYSDWLIVKEK